MWLTFCIQQNVSRFNVPMKNSMLVRVMDRSRHLRDEFYRAPNRHRLASGQFVNLSAFDGLHAEVAWTTTLAHFMDRNDIWRLLLNCRFCFHPKPLHEGL